MLPSPDHPIHPFSFEILNENVEALLPELNEAIQQLAASRTWVIAPPALYDSDTEGSTEDSLVNGGYLDIYSALANSKLSNEVDMKHLEEVTSLIRCIQEFSRHHKLDIDCYLGNTFVGSIQEGATDNLIEEALLGEWRKHTSGVS